MTKLHVLDLTIEDKIWLAGIFDVKGSLYKGNTKKRYGYIQVSINVKEDDVAKHIEKLLIWKSHKSHVRSKGYHSINNRFLISGKRAGVLIELLKPYMRENKFK